MPDVPLGQRACEPPASAGGFFVDEGQASQASPARPGSPRAVVFDWGGVLMRTVDPQPRRALEAQHGLPPGSVEALVFDSPAWARCQLGQLSDEQFWAEFGRQHGLPDAEAFRRQFFAGDQLDQELLAFALSLRPACRTAILSNFSSRLRELLDQHGLGSAFDTLVISSEEGLAKPEARLYQRVCQRLAVRPAQAVLLDDGLDNVRGAQQAGLHAIRFVSTRQAVQAVQVWLAT